MQQLNLQIHHGNAWHDIADLHFLEPEKGIAGRCTLYYDIDYIVAHAPEVIQDAASVRDYRAASVALPLTIEAIQLPNWPAFLLDLIPQGEARRRIMAELGYGEDDARGELPLLLRGAANPIGNLRIREAAEAEAERLVRDPPLGLDEADIFSRSPRFTSIADTFAYFSAGSSGVQGEWPKALMARQRNGGWYPAACVELDEANDHAIFKFLKGNTESDRLILASEASYLEVARRFGLRVAMPMVWRNSTLKMPRFDRVAGQLLRLGQESLVSACGIAAFGHRGHHEDYVAMLRRVCTEPETEIAEYILRDVLNMAAGNPDNHGRNTALQKHLDGSIALTPLFDFNPMILEERAMPRSTRWRCLGGDESDPDWRRVIGAVALDEQEAQRLRRLLAGKADFIASLSDIARDYDIAPAVIGRAMARHGEIAASLRRLEID